MKNKKTRDEIKNDQTSESTNETNNEIYCFHLIENLKSFFFYAFEHLYFLLNFTFNLCSIYLLWILLHYVSSHLYVYLCVPKSIYGFLISPLLISTPHCNALRWCISNGPNVIQYMWSNIGVWITTNIYSFIPLKV